MLACVATAGVVVGWGVPGCAGPQGTGKAQATEPVADPPDSAKLWVKIVPQSSRIGRRVASALGAALTRAGVFVQSDARATADAELRLSLDVRSRGDVVEGVTTLSVDSQGVLVDRFVTQHDVFRRDAFARAVARELLDAWRRSPRVQSFTQARLGGRHHAPRDAGASGRWHPGVVIPEAVERRRLDLPKASPTDAEGTPTAAPASPADAGRR